MNMTNRRRVMPTQRRMVAGLSVLLVMAVLAGCARQESGAGSEDGEDGGNALVVPGADCMAPSQEVLLGHDFAFDGTMTAATDGRATFTVHTWFQGGDGAEVTLEAGGLLMEEAQALIGSSLQVGQRYLISGSDGMVWACGYSLTYDAGLAAEWAELFAGASGGGNALSIPGERCAEPSDEVLLGHDFAFDGTMTAAADGRATFAVETWFHGGEGAEVTLEAGGLLSPEAQALIGSSLQIGQRYLISGSDGMVWACGYSLTYDADLAAEWAALFG